MKGKIIDSLKPSLTKRPSELSYWKLNEMPGSSECLRQKHQFWNFWGKTIWVSYGKRAKSKWERRVLNRWNNVRKRGFTVNGWQSRILNSETYTLNKSDLDFDKELCYCTCLHEMLEVNYLKGKCNKRQQLPLCPPLFFAFCSEFLNSGIKSCFDGVVFQDAACEECFSYVFGVFTFRVFLLLLWEFYP